MAFQSRIFAFVLSLASVAYCGLAAGDELNNDLRPQYPMTEARQGEENKPNSWRHAISVHALTAPLTVGWVATGLVLLGDEPTSLGSVANGGLQMDYYQYRFGIVRIGLGLHWRMEYHQSNDPLFDRQLHDFGLPFVVSVMKVLPKGVEFGGTFSLGLGIVGLESTNLNDNCCAPGTNMYLPKQWYWGPFVSGQALITAAFPMGRGFDFSIRAGVEGAYGAIWRISTPLELGIRKRF